MNFFSHEMQEDVHDTPVDRLPELSEREELHGGDLRRQ
jgi:hypothetical protein